MNKRRIQPRIEGLVLDADLSLMLPTVNRGRVGNQSLLDVHGVITGRPAGAFVSATSDHATIEEGLITQFPFTVKGRFLTASSGVQSLFWCGDKDASNDFWAVYLNAGDFIVTQRDGDFPLETITATLDDDVTHDWSVTAYVDGSDVKVDVWIDGAFVDTLTNAAWATTFWSDIAADRTAIGRFMDAASPAAPFDGKLWDYALYDGKDATVAEMLRLYDGWRIVTPTAEWKFSEGTGAGADAVADTSGNAKHLTTTGMGWDLGENGGDLNLTAAGRVHNGVSDYVEFPNVAALRLRTSDFQIHYWFKAPAQVNAAGRMIGVGSAPVDGHWEIDILQAGGNIRAYTGVEKVEAGGDWQDDTWHFLSFLRSGTSIAILIDTVSKGTDTVAVDDLDNAASPLQIGWSGSTASREFTGEIGRVWIATATKTIAQGTLDAIALYERTKP
jgi:hypothetical protein